MQYEFLKQQLCLLSERAIWWENRQMLLVADVHLGKVGHFRKAGIPIPSQIHQSDLQLLGYLIAQYKPASLTILGDLFHSKLNSDWNFFEEWLSGYKHLTINLVRGNHDIIPSVFFERNNIMVYEETWEVAPFIFSHIPLPNEQIGGESYNLCGHLHPAVALRGKGKQMLRLPCFYFGQKQGYLPAFGNFTGTAAIQPKEHDVVFVITENKVIQV
ncbi:MAG: ligase-associated DNA damage response endonuclease PdeM [Cytophagales bacterium]|nr:MAG: ligase-associated DNA damage response endonuclease PdeM [Cytophagales bacterium]